MAAGDAAAADFGRALYEGSGETGVQTFVGTAPAGSAELLACRKCHGRDGLGGQEGRAPPIVWESLAAETASRPPYDARSFMAALVEGRDPSGRSFDQGMPRYGVNDAQAQQLVDYLKGLKERSSRGISARAIVFGVAAPQGQAETAAKLAQELRAEFSRLSGDRRIFNRAVEFRLLPGSEAEIASRASAEIAAVVGLLPPLEPLAAALQSEGVPILFPLAPLAGDEDKSLVRGVLADRKVLWRRLAAAAAEDGVAALGVIGDAPDFVEKPRLLRRDLKTPPPAGLRAVALLDAGVTATELDSWLPAGAAVYAQVPGPDFEGLSRLNRPITLVTGYRTFAGADFMDGYARVIAELLLWRLKQGRSLTRASLVSGFDGKPFADLGLDYYRDPLSGTDETRIIRNASRR